MFRLDVKDDVNVNSKASFQAFHMIFIGGQTYGSDF